VSVTRLPKVLIIAGDDDVHAQALCRHYESKKTAEAYLLDSALFPQRVKLAYTTSEETTFLTFGSGRTLVDEEIAGIWYRRPKPHDIDQNIKEERARKFAAAESRALFQGWLCRCGNRVINPIASDRVAHFKPFQLAKARSVGLNVPDTLISNDRSRIAQFLDQWDEKIIFKTLTTTPGKLRKPKVGRQNIIRCWIWCL
jgi:glutathione synthase/RimK-type ligase-like ATP-grasp enzyme